MERYNIILKKILTEYNLKSNIINIEPITQYPHMFIIHMLDYSIIVKVVNINRVKFEDINMLYRLLEENEYILKPEKTKEGKYCINIREENVFIYKKCRQLQANLQSDWWSECLSSIHSNQFITKYNKSFLQDIYHQTECLLNDATKFIEEDLKEKMYSLFSKSNLDIEIPREKIVLCHNDPYILNVIKDNNFYRMIDTEGMGLAPLEYDIQRLFYNQALISEDIDELEKFWQNFIYKYEKITNKKINLDLLKNIYLCDLIRSMSWLYIVSNDSKRQDKERQRHQLELYKNSLKKDIHKKILKKL